MLLGLEIILDQKNLGTSGSEALGMISLLPDSHTCLLG